MFYKARKSVNEFFDYYSSVVYEAKPKALKEQDWKY